jgi:hypothetical protein
VTTVRDVAVDAVDQEAIERADIVVVTLEKARKVLQATSTRLSVVDSVVVLGVVVLLLLSSSSR